MGGGGGCGGGGGGGGCVGGDCSNNDDDVDDDVFFLLGDYVGTLNSDARESPKRKNATFRKRRKFEIKNDDIITSCDVAWKHDDNIVAISIYVA